ncbi:DUF4377 domain-containing protein [Thiopseudomonas alkaliphila]|uniref:DUF4377 domain-containing protein n=1 Tax=Thiopseudomonas alkaliphila TaxID=1697053 RepID=UPI002574EB2C|nr:DUF4377 domain-containing protein [Thiopseudomonas alkaliphila]MDM1715536.1 DUF4377 domain-containing protein [Thiopseudomonas alkaliphila]
MVKRSLFITAALLGSLAGCQVSGDNPRNSDGIHKTLYVKESLVDCVGGAPMKCMQVRDDSNQEWTYFYSNIQGFNYEPGYRYKLKVKVENVENPPADASSKRYILISIDEKTKSL